LPISLLAWGEKRIDSGLAAVIQASAPLFTALLALRFSRDEVVSGSRLVGLLVALGVIGTGLAYVLYYALLAGAGASRSILITYLVPAIALGYGAIILDEPVTVAALAGLALVLGGVALGTGVLRLARRRVQATEVGG
jgi:drug/metabolite transporter (DMT)-like permease